MDVEALLAGAVRCEEEGRLDDAFREWLEVVRVAPTIQEPYERLFDLHVHRREVDAAFCAASVLASLGALDGMRQELYEDYLPRRLTPHVRALEARDWEVFRHPLEDRAFGETLLPALSKVRVPRASADAIDAPSYLWAAALLGVDPGEVAPDKCPPLVPHGDLDEVWGNHPLRERLFFAGRAAAIRCVPAWAIERVPTKGVAEALGIGDKTPLHRWRAGVQLSTPRAGLLVCGEPAVALRILEREDADEVERGQLALFAVSPDHHRLRKKLGLAIGMSADAPTLFSSVPAPIAVSAPTPVATREAPPPKLVAFFDAIGVALPRTVRDLERALRMTLTDSHLANATEGAGLDLREGLPPPFVRLCLQWRGATMPKTVESLRGRALASGWLVAIAGDRAYLDARLRTRFAAPQTRGDEDRFVSKEGTLVLTSSGDTCTLSFTEPELLG